MSRGSLWRGAAALAQAAALAVSLGCESGSPTAPWGSTVPPVAPALPDRGAVSGTVTINGEARPIVWVELHRRDQQLPWAYDTTIPDGRWEWAGVPAGDHVVVIKPPPGLTCDATSKPATVRPDQRTVVDFACVGDVKGSIQGFAVNEFGTMPSARINLTGPVNRESISNGDGFFAFEDLPPGEYAVRSCPTPVTAIVRDGATAFAIVDCS